MKYSELIQFEPINEVVKFGRIADSDYRRSLVRNFVSSPAYEDAIIPEIVRQLDYTAGYETKGIQIVGTYGTGKSHLMSLVSLIAEDSQYLSDVRNASSRQVLGNIAGKYMVIRFEMGSHEELWRLVGHQIDQHFRAWGIDYSILADNKPDMYKDKLSRMLAHFEARFPDKGLLIVIDEMHSYLKGHSNSVDVLNRDLAVLQAYGQMCDHSKFRIIYGVQELIYNSPEFHIVAESLNRVADRYASIQITKQDVQYVVQQRLLRKDDSQRAAIRRHLEQFAGYFTDMHAHMDEYVSLFPVHPSFFDNFQAIKLGKAQREVLKTLSNKFVKLLDQELPADQPGLISYDAYWQDLQSPEMQTHADIRRVSEIMTVVHQKIDDNFVGARARKGQLAHRIANACAVKILQDTLEHTNGSNAERLVDDLCYMEPGCLDRDFLIDIVNTTAKLIVTATVGQYFEHNSRNQEYHLRIEGGVNYEQKIREYAGQMPLAQKDRYYYGFLAEYLPVDGDKYRMGFDIYRHSLLWHSHNVMLDGYVFMGNPTERSTTQPEQKFYIYFMPIFDRNAMQQGDEADSVYVRLDKVSDEMKSLLELYGAALSLEAAVDSSQKQFYRKFAKDYAAQLRDVFNRDFKQAAEIYYQGELQSVSPDTLSKGSKMQAINDVASRLLEAHFAGLMPDYPKFGLLQSSLTRHNRAQLTKSARMMIADPAKRNRDGEAILAALDLFAENQLNADGSQYAQSILHRLEQKGAGQVLNRDEILHIFYNDKDWLDVWFSNDFNIEADLEFVVLLALVALGHIEISLRGGKVINAVNLKDFVDLPEAVNYDFSHVSRPKQMDVACVRQIFIAVTGRDLTAQINNREIYPHILIPAAKRIAATAVKLAHDLGNGVVVEGVEVIPGAEVTAIKNRLQALAGFCDRLQTYNSPSKIANIPWRLDDGFKIILDTIPYLDQLRRRLELVEAFRTRLTYLSAARNYMSLDSMRAKVASALERLPQVVADMDDAAAVAAYRAQLDAIIGEYADWYMAEYNRLHINALQDTDKRKLLNSPVNKICEIICGNDHGRGYFAVAETYMGWMKRMSQLSMASPSVTRQSVLKSPYQGFNPASYSGVSLPKLTDLSDELANIHAQVDDALHGILGDKQLTANADVLLDASEQQLLKRFNDGQEQLTQSNAQRLIDIVPKLHQGVNRITVTAADIRKVLNRPMTPDEAKAALRKFIDNLAGTNKDNVRIILK